MNTALVFATVVALLVCAAYSDQHVEKKEADKLFLTKEMNILQLLHRIHQDSVFKDQVDVGNTYDIEAHISSYKHPKVVKDFIFYYKKGVVKRWEPFSVYYKVHLQQAISLFELLYYANDFDTFYKTACWARDRVNPLMFWYSFSTAVLHREDTSDIVLPPPYDIYPYFFVDSDVILKGYKYWMMHVGTPEQHNAHIIPMNHTMKSMDSMLSYFTEDVGLNTFNMYYRMIYPSWFNVTEYGHKIDRRGELFLYVQHQLFARYCIERWSNGMPDVEVFLYNKPLKTVYNPNLMYHSGELMPPRPSNLLVENFDIYTIEDIKNYERRVMNAIDVGYVKDEHLKVHPLYDVKGIEYLGKIIDGTYDSPHVYFYGSLFHMYRMMLGHTVDPFHKYGLAPSALEHPHTTLRDPAYYQLYKRIYHMVKKYKDRLPSYTRDELLFEGLKVENVEVSKMQTYMENFDTTLGTTIYVPKEEDILSVNMHARHLRLNHKPFTYKIEVSSEKAVDAYVRVFLVPKTNYLGEEWDINERRHYFIELDRFLYHVQAGKTVIERSSQDSSIIAPTPDGYKTLYKKVKDAFEGKTKYYIDKGQIYCGFPENLLLPKGQKIGQVFTFFVILTPYVKQHEHEVEPNDYKAFSYCGVGLDHKYPDDKPLGFPFDRQIRSKDFYTSNMFLKDVVIVHKKLDDVSLGTH